MCCFGVQDSDQGMGRLSAHEEPINCKKIVVALAIIFSICALIVIAVGIAGYLHPESLNDLSKLHSITMMVVGSATLLLSIAGIGTLLYLNTHRKEEVETLLPREPNPLTRENWENGLNLGYVSEFFPKEYNLTAPGQQVAPASYNSEALPTFGNYPYPEGLIYAPCFGVRLPRSQLQGFPQDIQDLFKNCPNVELFFLIYNDNKDLTTRRNLVLHRMAHPTYNPDQKPVGYELKCTAQVGLFAPKGIHGRNEEGTLPIDKGLRDFTVWMHKTSEASGYGTSPNNCVFEIQSGVSTCNFYTAAQFEGRSVAFYTLLIRDKKSQEAALLQQAMEKEHLSASLEVLSQENSPCSADVKKLFAYYP